MKLTFFAAVADFCRFGHLDHLGKELVVDLLVHVDALRYRSVVGISEGLFSDLSGIAEL